MRSHRKLIAQSMYQPPSGGIITDGLIMRHVMQDPPDGPVTDVSGNGWTATPQNLSAGAWVSGRVQDYAIRFTTTNQGLLTAFLFDDSFETSGLSIIMWMANIPTNDQYRTEGFWDTPFTRFLVGTDTADGDPKMYTRIANTIYTTPAFAQTKEWWCLGYRIQESTGVQMFLDGVEQPGGTTSPLTLGFQDQVPFNIGRSEINIVNSIRGDLDEHRLYNRLLTDQEFLAIANDQG